MTRTLTDLGLLAIGYRCECTGDCGKAHKKAGDGRCHVEDHPSHPLALLSPGKVLTDAVSASRDDLVAWCPACQDQHAKTARMVAASVPDPDQLDIFDVLEGGPA